MPTSSTRPRARGTTFSRWRMFGLKPHVKWTTFGRMYLPHNPDRIHVFHEHTEHCRLVAGSGSHLEHAMPGSDVQRLGHERDDIRLGDGLTVADRQRPGAGGPSPPRPRGAKGGGAARGR